MNGTAYALTVRNVQFHDPIRGAAGYLSQVEIPLTSETAPGVALILNRRFSGRTIAMTTADVAVLESLQNHDVSDPGVDFRVTHEGPQETYAFASGAFETTPIYSTSIRIPATPDSLHQAAQVLDKYGLLTDPDGYFMMGLIEHGLAKDAGNGSRPIGRIAPILASSVTDLVEHDGRGTS